MLVILRENVENLGRIGDAVTVSDGYARNYLLPRNLVLAADEKNLAMIEHQKRTLEKKRLAERASAEELAKKLNETSCTLNRKSGEHDKLFGSVNAGDIADALKKVGLNIEKRMIQLTNPIKTLGVHPVTVKLEPEVSATLKVWIVKEE
ncbi:MAG TPA: 50S ribosomal protein L9 [Bdellovibrionales bacterium]|nr:MAG: 50S ribosomal protein L9 [Bdellovibrionales bacterium GWB1_52_6]OFZ03493.1 MAG: 50S ribosomal protein L9 [Bdellovibrionales bacterium GWA1_52_35]OFZ37955.1 MAG: 50S ribosomal protein L9 [Bdellovibrionales bacterium GWC1_52_8]HAR44438.1 50S ribosomal protein L9 [Bdellovibrionales bacterium]HCM41078.1 50S ribosomal protein L9 [Bdellovibrionales bacterium]